LQNIGRRIGYAVSCARHTFSVHPCATNVKTLVKALRS
jgi:hypothetical protein